MEGEGGSELKPGWKVMEEWEQQWEEGWEEKNRNKMLWKTLFSLVFEKERADRYADIFDERGLDMREVLERGKVQEDIKSRGEKFLR